MGVKNGLAMRVRVAMGWVMRAGREWDGWNGYARRWKRGVGMGRVLRSMGERISSLLLWFIDDGRRLLGETGVCILVFSNPLRASGVLGRHQFSLSWIPL